MLFPTSLVGSYPQPDWLIDRERLGDRFPPRVRARELWRVDQAHLAEAQRDATLLAILAQEQAGLDIVTDGEICRESYSNRFATALDGVDIDHPGTALDRSGTPTQVPRVTGRSRAAIPSSCATSSSSRRTRPSVRARESPRRGARLRHEVPDSRSGLRQAREPRGRGAARDVLRTRHARDSVSRAPGPSATSSARSESAARARRSTPAGGSRRPPVPAGSWSAPRRRSRSGLACHSRTP